MGMYSAALFNSQAAEIEDFTQYVNPFIGTDYTSNTYPGVQMSHGLVQLSPDNGLPGWDRIAGYFYPDSTIARFSRRRTHLQISRAICNCTPGFRCFVNGRCLTANG